MKRPAKLLHAFTLIIVAFLLSNTTLTAAPHFNPDSVEIKLQPKSQIICTGKPINLSVSTAGVIATFQWYKNNVPINGAIDSVFNIQNSTYSDSGTYYVVIKNTANETSKSNDAKIKVVSYQSLVISQQPSIVYSCDYDSAVISVKLLQDENVKYQWRRNKIPIPNTNTPSISIKNLPDNQYSSYDVQINNYCGDTLISQADTLRQIKPDRFIQDTYLDVFYTTQGNYLQLYSPVMSCIGNLSFQWYHNNEPIAGATLNYYGFLVNSCSDEGDYYLIATSPKGYKDTSVSRNFKLNGFSGGYKTTYACTGQSVVLRTNIISCKKLIRYQWYKYSTGLIPGATDSILTIPNASPNNQGEYYVFVVNETQDSGYVYGINLTVINSNSLIGSIYYPFQYSCDGQSASIYVNSNQSGVRFQWRKNGVPILGQNSYQLNITDIKANVNSYFDVILYSVCGDSVVVKGDTLTKFETTLIVKTGLPIKNTYSYGNYTYLTVPTITCMGYLNYKWYKNGVLINQNASILLLNNISCTDTGKYSVVVFNNTGAYDSAWIYDISIFNKPSIVELKMEGRQCRDSSITFRVTANSCDRPLTYMWFKDGNEIAGAKDSVYTISKASPLSNGQYNVKVTSNSGEYNYAYSQYSYVINATPISITYQSLYPSCDYTKTNFSVDINQNNYYNNPTFSWYENTKLIATNNNRSYQFNNPTNNNGSVYQVKVTGICGDTAWSKSDTLKIPLPIKYFDLTSQNIYINTLGNAFSLGAYSNSCISDVTIQWYKNGLPIPGATSNTYYKDNSDCNDVGEYYAIAKIKSPYTFSDTTKKITVNISNKIQFINTTKTQYYCKREKATLSFQFKSCTNPVSIQWYYNNNPIPGAIDTFYTINAISATDQYSYSVKVKNNNGDSLQNQFYLYIQNSDSLYFYSQSKFAINCTFTEISKYVNISYGFSNLQWLRNSIPIPGATNTYLTVPYTIENHKAVYQLIATNSCKDTLYSDKDTVMYTSKPLLIDKKDSTYQFSLQSNWYLSPNMKNYCYMQFQWLKNGEILPGEINMSLSKQFFTCADAGEYRLIATIENYSDTSGKFIVTNKTPFLFTSYKHYSTPCIGNPYKLGVNISKCNTNLSFQWLLNGAYLLNQKDSILIIPNLQKTDLGYYSVIVKSSTGDSVVTDSYNLNAFNLDTLKFTKEPQFNFNCILTYAYINSNVNTTIYSPSYKWIENNNTIVGTMSDLYLTPPSTYYGNEYKVVVTNGCGDSIVSIPQKFVRPEKINFITTQPSSIFITTPARLANGIVLYAYTIACNDFIFTWYKNGVKIKTGIDNYYSKQVLTCDDAGSYYVIVSNNKGYFDTSRIATVTIKLLQPDSLKLPALQKVCAGSSITLKARYWGCASSPIFQWYKNGNPIAGATDSALIFTNTTSLNTGVYSFKVWNSQRTDSLLSTNSQLAVTETGYPKIISQPVFMVNCPGGTASITVVTAQPKDSYLYQWRKNGQVILGATGSTYTISKVLDSHFGVYDVIITNPCTGEVTISNTDTLQLFSMPVILQGPRSIEICESKLPVEVSVSATGQNLRYLWSFSNTLKGYFFDTITTTPKFIYTVPEKNVQYNYKVTVLSGSCATQSYSSPILVESIPVYKDLVICSGETISIPYNERDYYSWSVSTASLYIQGYTPSPTTVPSFNQTLKNTGLFSDTIRYNMVAYSNLCNNITGMPGSFKVTVRGKHEQPADTLQFSQLFNTNQLNIGDSIVMLAAIRNLSSEISSDRIGFTVTKYNTASGLVVNIIDEPSIEMAGTRYTLSSQDFDFTSNNILLFGKIKQGVVIPAKGFKILAFSIKRNAGSKGNVTSTLTEFKEPNVDCPVNNISPATIANIITRL